MRPAIPFAFCLLAVAGVLLATACRPTTRATPADPTALRVATFNGSLYDARDGGLVARLEAGDEAARKIAAVIQHRRPDLLLLNEFDYDASGRAADLFQQRYLEVSQSGQEPIRYPYRFFAPVNTGVPSGMDLDRDGKVGGGNDAFGFGLHAGQYGMLVLSRYPIDHEAVRTFQHFPWKDLPGARSPVDPKTGADWYPPELWSKLRLSSKSHWDVPVRTPVGVLHFLVHHPTPPVFDGPEDRHGLRNADEIRFWGEYVSARPAPWLCDDQGRCGGLASDALFVIAGDHNADPSDGDSIPHAIDALLGHPRVLRVPAPRSEGAVVAARDAGGANLRHRGDPAEDTGKFGVKVGNLRLDYLLPSTGLRVRDSGVFWPAPGQPGAEWLDATDHHLVWMDLLRD
jgi:hypothetical protein